MDGDAKVGRLLLVVLLVTVSGCATISVDSRVTADGTIDQYNVEIDTSRQAYGFLQSAAEEEGYDSVEAYLLSDVDESGVEDIAYREDIDGEDVTLYLNMSDLDPANSSALSVTRSEGQLTFTDEIFYNESAQAETDSSDSSEFGAAMASGFAIDYYLTMPGEITESNADEVDGNTAEWHATGSDALTDADPGDE